MKETVFPEGVQIGEISKLQGGLTKREYFAGLAMMNLQNVLLRKSGEKLLQDYKDVIGTDDAEEIIAKLALSQADALIEELGK